MKILIFSIFAFLFIAPLQISAQATLDANVRLATSGDDKSIDLMGYSITTGVESVDFVCKNNSDLSFTYLIVDTIDVSHEQGYKVLTLQTDEDDHMSLMYDGDGKLVTVCIHQINGVDLYYMYSVIQVEEPKEETKTFRS